MEGVEADVGQEDRPAMRLFRSTAREERFSRGEMDGFWAEGAKRSVPMTEN